MLYIALAHNQAEHSSTPVVGKSFMQLYEFQAKQVFREYGIPIPKGRIVRTAEEAVQVAEELGGPVAVKAQVLTGGRGLAGGVRFGRDAEEVGKVATLVLGMRVRGEKPKALVVEEKLEVARELYAAVTWDYQLKCPVAIASSRGGVDIETIAKERPSDIARKRIDPFRGFSAYQGRELATEIGLKNSIVIEYAKVMSALWTIFHKHDAELVEANPLAVLANGNLVALDAKLNLDDKSIFRQSSFLNGIEQMPAGRSDEVEYRRARARELGISTYVEMDGNIGVVADGAGSGMLTLDLVSDFGGKTQVYCEMGGEANPQLMENAMLATMTVESVKVVLINLIGGLNRMDEMAKGITSYITKHPSKVPIVVRMSGTMQEEGRRILTASGIQFFDSLYEAVEEAVTISRAN